MQLTNTSVAQLFTVPESDWTAMNKRVGVVEFSKGIADQISQVLPKFPQLVTACDLWMSTTFPGLVSHAQGLAAYADHFTQQFTDLQNALAALGPDTNPLPEGVRLQAQAVLQDLQQTSKTLGAEFDALSRQVTDFASANSEVDAELARLQSQMGPGWAPLGAIISKVDQATGLVRGVWSAITSDLDNALSGPLDITDAFLMGLDTSVALSTWATIKEEAAAFGVIANGQTQYWTNWQ